MNPTTLTALMEANRGAARSVVYLEGEREERPVTFSALHERALGILFHLQELGARAGDRVILLLSANEPFVDAFWAAILGGIIPVPVAPGISDEHRHKLLRIARQLGEPFLYTERRLLERIAAFAAAHDATELFDSLRARAFLVDELESIGRPGKVHRARPEDVAFIQFSSGSTSAPKGVVLTHQNLIANIHGITAAAALREDDVGLSWMPLTHDMGLIGFHLTMFANCIQSHLMSTELFVRRPLLWLSLASSLRATLLCSPNFGYRHYLKALGKRALDGLDLSGVRLIFNGAEPISVELCNEFLTRLESTGLKRTTMFPVYGLAEASLAVCFPPPEALARSVFLDRQHLGVGSQVHPVGPDSIDAVSLISVGRTVPECELRVVDHEDLLMPEGRVGHVLIRGNNVTRGYLDADEANALAFTADGWLRTGDLGLVLDGDVFIAGRHKEILFVNGQNYYPHDLERMLESIPELSAGRLVIAGVRPPSADSERLLAFVLHRGEMNEFLLLARQLARELSEHAGLELDAIVPVRRIPKTTSGKVQRHLLAREYLEGAFDAELAELERLGGAVTAAATPDGAIEQQLQTLCEIELDGRRVDPEESLFDLGASSLKLISIHERIEQRWPGAVEMTDIFEHPTIRALSRFIESRIEARP